MDVLSYYIVTLFILLGIHPYYWSAHVSSACNSEKFRFSAEFIETRRQALDIFINRIASHPELKQSEDLRIFLQEDEEVKVL